MDRHPSRVNPNCPFGQLLKTFFKKDQFVEALFNDYTRDNYWSRLGQVRFDVIDDLLLLFHEIFSSFAEQVCLRAECDGMPGYFGRDARPPEGDP